MKRFAALALGLVLVVPVNLQASIIESPAASVQGRDGPSGREYVLTFLLPEGVSGGDVEAAFLQCEGAFSDGIGVSAEVVAGPVPAAGTLATDVLIAGARNGTMVVAESLDGAIEWAFKGAAFVSLTDRQAMSFLIRPISQSRAPTGRIEPYLATARLVLIATAGPRAQTTR